MGRPRPTLGGRRSHARPRPTSGGRRSHGSSEANPGQETQSRLVRGQPRGGNAVTTRPGPTSGGRSSDDSPEANPGWETQSSPRSSCSCGCGLCSLALPRPVGISPSALATPFALCCTTRPPPHGRRCSCSVLPVREGVAATLLEQAQSPLAGSAPTRRYAASGAGYSFRLVLHDPDASSWASLLVFGPPSARGRGGDLARAGVNSARRLCLDPQVRRLRRRLLLSPRVA
jgi:hypothetical protein